MNWDSSLQIPDISLKFVDNLDTAAEFIEWIRSQGSLLALDTETTGLAWHEPHSLRLVQFGNRDSGWAVPWQGWGGVVVAALELLSARGTRLVMHNAPFDMHVLSSAGAPLPSWSKVEDTRILSSLHEPDKGAGLKGVAKRRLGPWAQLGQLQLKQEFRRTGTDWATIPVDNQFYWGYGVMDTVLTYLLYEELTPAPPRYDEVMAYQATIWRAEERGVCIDIPYLTTLKEDWVCQLQNLALDLKAEGISNPHANRQIETALVREGWDPQLFTDTGQAQLTRSVLEGIGEDYEHIVKPLLEFKQLNKWLKSYVNPMIEAGDVLHFNSKALAARTGRTSMSSPPFHQLPSRDHRVRRAVVAARGTQLVAIDYSNQEPRLMAHQMGMEAGGFVDAFVQHGDPYLAYASVVTDDPHSRRSQFKAIQLAISYGAAPRKVASMMGVSEAEAERYFKQIMHAFPDLDEFIEEQKRTARYRLNDEGQAYTHTLRGRRVPMDDDKIETTAVNYYCQGSGADVIHDAVNSLEFAGLGDYILFDIHDEVLLQFPEEEAEELTIAAKEAMTFELDPLPLEVDASAPSSDWSQTK